MAGHDAERMEGVPECGFYKTRNVKSGPWVPVRLFVQRDIDLQTGELTGPETIMAEKEGNTFPAARIWIYLRPISRDEYDRLVALTASDERMAATMAPVNLTTFPTRPPKGA